MIYENGEMPAFFREWLESLSKAQSAELYAWFDDGHDGDLVGEIMETLP